MLAISRRRFCKLAIGAGGMFVLGANRALGKTLRRDCTAFGTKVAVEAWHEDDDVRRKAVDAAIGELELVDSLMSLYKPESQICRLNRLGRLAKPHPYMKAAVKICSNMSRRTDGAFDITVQPLWALYAKAKQEGKLPADAEIEKSRRAVDWQRVKIDKNEIRLEGEDTAVTLNGIAQGFAADRAAAALRRHGIEHGLVNAGEIAAIGTTAEGEAWKIGVQHPRHDDAYIALAALKNRCLSTSGDYATAFDEDYTYNHIFDPTTGKSPRTFCSVTVAADRATNADLLSTALFAMKLESGVKLIESTPGADALFVFKDGRTSATKDFPIESK